MTTTTTTTDRDLIAAGVAIASGVEVAVSRILIFRHMCTGIGARLIGIFEIVSVPTGNTVVSCSLRTGISHRTLPAKVREAGTLTGVERHTVRSTIVVFTCVRVLVLRSITYTACGAISISIDVTFLTVAPLTFKRGSATIVYTILVTHGGACISCDHSTHIIISRILDGLVPIFTWVNACGIFGTWGSGGGWVNRDDITTTIMILYNLTTIMIFITYNQTPFITKRNSL